MTTGRRAPAGMAAAPAAEPGGAGPWTLASPRGTSVLWQRGGHGRAGVNVAPQSVAIAEIAIEFFSAAALRGITTERT
jgi:hypothetical protein